MSYRKINASTFPTVDAKSVLEVRIHKEHVIEADPGDPYNCAGVLAALDGHKELIEFVVMRTFAYGLFKGDTAFTRYSNPTTARHLVEHMDTDKAGLIKSIPTGGVVIRFTPPRDKVSLSYRRSKAFAARRKASRVKNAHKTKRRPYRLPDPKTLSGVRFGFARSGPKG